MISRLRQFFRSRKKRTLAISAFAMMAVLVFAATNVSTVITVDDADVFRKFYRLDPESVSSRSFDEEIKLIRSVQGSVLRAAPSGVGIPQFSNREPRDLIRARGGLCYDRSRSIEKALTFVGFKVRHVFLLYSYGKAFLPALIARGQSSHAVTEVLTRRGWLLVDSNTNWIALSDGAQPNSARDLIKSAGKFRNIPPEFTYRYWPLVGLYSRSGFLYAPYLPLPDVNWRDFISALLGN